MSYNTGQTPQYGKIRDPDLDEGDFVFPLKSSISAPVARTQPRPAALPRQSINAEEESWTDVKLGNTIEDYQDYLSEYPQGRFASIAKRRIRRLNRAESGRKTRLEEDRQRREAEARRQAEVRRKQREAEQRRLADERRRREAEARRQAAIRRDSGSRTLRDPVTGMEFVKVPGGSFQMGCHANAGKCRSNEKPVRTVRLDGFWMGKHEVTQGQWKRIMGSNPSQFKKGDNYPVEKVSWDNVQQFIRRLNGQSSANFSLPSEAQ